MNAEQHPENPSTEQPIPNLHSGKNPQEITWAWITFLSGFVQLLGLPFGHIIVPAVIWTFKKEKMPLVDEVGKEVINFQISYSIYAIISLLLMFVLIGYLIFPIVGILWIIFTIIGTLKASEGTVYRVPGIFRFIK